MMGDTCESNMNLYPAAVNQPRSDLHDLIPTCQKWPPETAEVVYWVAPASVYNFKRREQLTDKHKYPKTCSIRNVLEKSVMKKEDIAIVIRTFPIIWESLTFCSLPWQILGNYMSRLTYEPVCSPLPQLLEIPAAPVIGNKACLPHDTRL